MNINSVNVIRIRVKERDRERKRKSEEERVKNRAYFKMTGSNFPKTLLSVHVQKLKMKERERGWV